MVSKNEVIEPPKFYFEFNSNEKIIMLLYLGDFKL